MNLSRGCRRFCRTTLNIVSVCFTLQWATISTPPVRAWGDGIPQQYYLFFSFWRENNFTVSIDFLDKITEKSFLEIAESELYLHRDKYARKELQQKNVETPTSGREERITVVYWLLAPTPKTTYTVKAQKSSYHRSQFQSS